jgi:transposase
MPAAEIRSKTGVSASTIALWKKKWALEADPSAAARGQRRSLANRQGRRAYGPQTRARVSLYLAEGMPVQQISDRTGVPLVTIQRWRKEEARLPPNPALGLAWSQEVRERVAAYLDQGMAVPEINEKTGVPVSTIYTWKREEGDSASS